MHEHVRNQLIWLEIFRFREKQSQMANQIKIELFVEHIGGKEKQYIDDQKIFYNRWNPVHW